jgi:hypothetical protein
MPDKFTQLLPALGALVAFLVAAVLVLYIYRLLFGRRIRSPGGRNRARRLDVVDVLTSTATPARHCAARQR